MKELKINSNIIQLLKDNICWTATKEDIINNQIPDLIRIWLEDKFKDTECCGYCDAINKFIQNELLDELEK